jgi:hypothetical protein
VKAWYDVSLTFVPLKDSFTYDSSMVSSCIILELERS